MWLKTKKKNTSSSERGTLESNSQQLGGSSTGGYRVSPGSPVACGTHQRGSSACGCEDVSRRGCPGTAREDSSQQRPPSSLHESGGSHTGVSGGVHPVGGWAQCHQPAPYLPPPSDPQDRPQAPAPSSPPGSNCTDGSRSSRSRGAPAGGGPDGPPSSWSAALLLASAAAGTEATTLPGTLGDVVQAQLGPVFLPARGIRKGGRAGNHPEGRQPQAQAGLRSPENWAGACWGLKRKTTLAFQTALEQQVRWLKIQLGARPPRLAQLAANGSKFPRGQKARNCPFRLEERSEGRKGSGKALQESGGSLAGQPVLQGGSPSRLSLGRRKQSVQSRIPQVIY